MTIKILHILPNLGVGGTEKIILSLCTGLDRATFQQAVISLKSGGRTAEDLAKANIPVELLNSADGFGAGILDLPRLYSVLKHKIKEYGPDIVHTWLTRANVIGRLAARAAGIDSVISSLRVMEAEKKYHLWSERLTHRFCRKVTVNSTLLKNFAAEEIGIPEEKLVLIFNGIETPSLSAATSNPGTHPLKVGTMGRLHRQKGIDVFLKAAKIIIQNFPETKILVAGEGPERSSLEKLAEDLRIGNQVQFLGVKNQTEFLSTLDIFVLASRWEGMPNAVMEAMALQKPVVLTTVAGATDLIEDHQQGLLVPPEDEIRCAEAIRELVQNPDLRRTLARQAFEKIEKEFSLKKMLEAYAKLYCSLANEV